MNSKSAELLKELKRHIASGTIELNAFPKKGVMTMIHEEYHQWLTKQFQNLEEYLSIYGLLIDTAMEEENRAELADCLEDLVSDLQRIPEDISGKMTSLRTARDLAMIGHFKKSAKKAYDDYPYRSLTGESVFHGKGVVYTVITGGYDVLREPEYVNDDYDYICFTDNTELHSNIWEIRYIENPESLDNTRLARKHKILCHHLLPEYDYSIYVDGKIQIIGNWKEYIAKYSKGSAMLCFPHHMRQCVYDEAQICTALNLDNAEIINQQVEGYRQEGYPANNGLLDTACLVRSHTDECLQRVMESWWKEVKEKSKRDQLSIGYACWKNKFHYDLSDLFIYQNEYVCKRREGEQAW